jgi:GNAT superfamily N-acetyltransferase
VIRRATPADAEAVDGVSVRGWERAYTDFIVPDRMNSAVPREERVARWRERLGRDEIRTWVWDQDGLVAGFASAGRGEVLALYVEPAAQGAGVGSALLEHVERDMREEGSAEATLWVFAANGHGRAFYEARGWSLVPDSEEEVDSAAPGVCYRKAL